MHKLHRHKIKAEKTRFLSGVATSHFSSIDVCGLGLIFVSVLMIIYYKLTTPSTIAWLMVHRILYSNSTNFGKLYKVQINDPGLLGGGSLVLV